VWLFLATYPVFTLPVLATYRRVCIARKEAGNRLDGSTRSSPVRLVSFAIGLLPGVLLWIGYFPARIPGQPAELPVFLAAVLALIVFLVLSRYLSRTLVRLKQGSGANSKFGFRSHLEGSVRARFLTCIYLVVAASAMLVSLIPYSPLWSLPAIPTLLGSHALVLCGVVLLIDAIKYGRRFALPMAGLFMSCYLAIASIVTHVL